jgi:uncharacterized repeat protein (TIGR02543 family)
MSEDSQSYSYKVTFYYNDGSDSVVSEETVVSPATTLGLLPVDPVRPGYLFAGWNTAATGGGIAFTPNTVISRDIAVYAQWGSYAYTVTFESGPDASPADPSQKTVATPATTVDALPAPPTRAGYVFAGWNTVADGSGAAFTEAATVSGDISVYAQWVDSYAYTVSFDSNGGDSPANPAAKTVIAPATTVDDLPAPPTKAGKVFAGWNTAADGSGAAFTAATTVSGDISVYAQWVDSYAYTVSFDSNGGDSPANPVAKTVNAPATTVDDLPAPPTKAGKAFSGWNTAADGSGAAFTAATTVSGDISVYAQWVDSYAYTVSFDSNGGNSQANPAVKTVNAPATTIDALPAPPSRGGFAFTGWNTAADGSGAAFTEAATVNADVTVYAQWVASYAYTVSFDSNGGNSPANPAAKTVNAPATTIDDLPAPPARTGYIFNGWNTAKDGKGTAFTAATAVNATITVYAQWQSYTYVVTFNNNNGDSPANPGSRSVTSPATTVGTLPQPPGKAGFAFTGWNTAADGSGTAFTAATTVNATITVYAQWSLSYSYTVTFNANGGDSPANPAAKTVNAPATTIDALPAPPAKVGWAFNGWNTALNGSGTAFTADTTVNATITVYAQWVNDYAYTVSFDSNGGDSPANPASKTVNAPATTIDALPAPPSKAGQVFAGWNTALNGSGTAFTVATTVNATITVYAQWVNDYTYTVTFDANGGDSPANPAAKPVKAPATTIGALPAPPAKAGWAFAGWNSDPDGSGTAFAAATTVSADITVYAQWSSYAYTVNFDSNNGDSPANPASKTVIAPATTIDALPAPPTRAGWIFNGWNSDPMGVYGVPFTAATTVNATITVYAQWRSYTYTVTFNNNDGDSQANPGSRVVTSPATTVGTLPQPPGKAGFAFAGWNTAPDGSGTAFAATTTVNATITVYAQWVPFVATSQDIKLFISDPGAGALDETGFTLVQGGAASKTIGLAGTWDTTPVAEWKVDGRTVPGTGSSVTLDAADYTLGGHRLQVTVYQGEKPWSKTLDFTVIAAVITLDINKTSLNLSVGSGETLLVRATPINAANKAVTWTSDNTAVATVSSTGTISAVGLGTALITAASVEDPLITVSCTVTVTAPLDIALALGDPGQGAFDELAFTLVQDGALSSKTIGLVGTWDAAEWKVDGRIVGSGSVSGVTLDAADYTLGGHRLQVTATKGTRPWSKTLDFTVIAAVISLDISKISLNLSVGAQETLLVRTVPINAANKAVTWTSSNTAVATVSQTGAISAVSLGTAVITATSAESSTITAACTVTVGISMEIELKAGDPGTGALSQGSFALSKTGSGASQTITLTLSGTSWDADPAEWRVDGSARTSGGTCVLNAENYTAGGHILHVTAYQGGKPWSKTIAFTVTN